MFVSLRNNRGMTLIEIIIVVTILAALVAMLGTRVADARRKSQVKEARIQIGEIRKALDMYFTDCSKYPSTAEGFNALVAGGESTCQNWGPEPYMNKIPKDPWNNPFQYYNEGGKVVIISYGEDGREGGTGYAKDVSSED